VVVDEEIIELVEEYDDGTRIGDTDDGTAVGNLFGDLGLGFEDEEEDATLGLLAFLAGLSDVELIFVILALMDDCACGWMDPVLGRILLF